MASKSKQGMTIAKRQREQRVKERRELKAQKRRDKKQPAAEDGFDSDEDGRDTAE